MAKNSFILSLLFVILSMEVCYGIHFLFLHSSLNFIFFIYIYLLIREIIFVGDSFSRELKTILVIPCITIVDCYMNKALMPCDVSKVACFEGTCVCNKNQKSGI